MYAISFPYKIMKASESIFGMVSGCLPGCFSAYRRVCVHVMEEWMNEKVFGVERYGGDAALTNLVLRVADSVR